MEKAESKEKEKFKVLQAQFVMRSSEKEMKREVYVVSETDSRRLTVHPSEQEREVILCRVWKPTAPGFVGETDVMEVSLAELEQIVKHYNGGEKNG